MSCITSIMDKWLQRWSMGQTPAFRNSLPTRFHAKLSSPVNTMELRAALVSRGLAMWGKCGCAGGVTESVACIVCCYRENPYLYTETSAKDHERQWQAGVGSTTFNVDLNSPLPSREAVTKNKHNNCDLSRILSTFILGYGVSVESRDDGVFLHDEADITIISYLFQAADDGCQVVRIHAAGVLDVALRSTGSCCCADGEVGWCFP